jgi:hypothetical protein
MFSRRRSITILFLIVATLMAGGCSSRLVHREDLEATGKIALVSTVMPRVADTAHEANRKVLQAAVDRAAVQVRTGLAGVRPWKVLDAAAVSKGKAVVSFGKVSLKDLSALFPETNEQNRMREAVGAELESWRERFIGAAGLPIIPREALAPDEEQSQKDPAIRTVVLDQAGKLCSALHVDAVVFAHVRCTITHPREKAFIVTDDRTDGQLALSATLVIVDKHGRIVVDMDVRPIDDLSPSRDLLPLYLGKGREAVTAANIDLADPKKKISQTFSPLVDAAVADLMARLKTELEK